MSFPSEFISVFARNCEVRRIDSVLAKEFTLKHHRFGWSSCRYCYGLFVTKSGRDGVYAPGDLVAVSCFSSARRWNKGERSVSSYEWVRYASLSGVRVAGGMSKMLKAFVDEVHPDDVMSYAPLVEGDEGLVYLSLGFVLEGVKDFGSGKSAKYRLKLKNY